MIKDAKKLNVLFRICIFALFVMTVISLSSLLVLVVKVTQEQDNKSISDTEKLYNVLPLLKASFVLYYYIFILTLATALLSIASGYGSQNVSIVFRTIFLGLCAFLQFRGLGIARLIKLVTEALSKVSYDEIAGRSNDEIEAIFLDKGYSSDEFDKIFDASNSKESTMMMLAAYALSMIVFLVLSLTSLHSLYKQLSALKSEQSMYDAEQQPGPQRSGLAMTLSDNAARATMNEIFGDIKELRSMPPPEFRHSNSQTYNSQDIIDDDDDF